MISDLGARFENFIALHLLKWVFFQQDCLGKDYELRYYSDKLKREVDFALTLNRKLVLFVEVKHGDAECSPGLMYLKYNFPETPSYQVHLTGKKEYLTRHGFEVVSALRFLSQFI